jgi:hypothetical protein
LRDKRVKTSPRYLPRKVVGSIRKEGKRGPPSRQLPERRHKENRREEGWIVFNNLITWCPIRSRHPMTLRFKGASYLLGDINNSPYNLGFRMRSDIQTIPENPDNYLKSIV